MAVTNIPTPDNDVLQTWFKGTRDKKLVYSTIERKWKIVQANKVAKNDITYESFQQGKKTYETLKSDGTPQEISVDWAKKRYENLTNPLKKYIDEYGLSVKVEEDGTAYLADKQNKPYYLYFTSDGTLKIDFDYDKVKKVALNDLKKTGQLNTLFNELYKRKLIDKKTYDLKSTTTNQFNQALKFFINEYSKSVIELNKPNKTPQNFFEFVVDIAGEPSAGAKPDLPVRDINLIDRDVVEAIVKDVYSRTTDMAIDDAFLKQETDRYMDQIEKGVLTTTKVEGKEVIRRTTKPFSEAQVRAELPGRIETERPDATKYKKNLDFLAFLDGMGAPIV